jgi:hypothetical protein
MANDRRSSQLLLGLGAVVLLGVVIVLAWLMLNDDTHQMPEPAPVPLGPETVSRDPSGLVQTASDDGDHGGLRGRQSQTDLTAEAPVTVVSFEDDSLSFAATLPAKPGGDPTLEYLAKDADTYLKRMKPAARAEIDAAKAAGQTAHPWDIRVDWSYTARAGSLVSLAGRASEFSGGAHPSEFFDAHIASLADGIELELADMLLPDKSPSPAITIAICEALKAAKRERIGEETMMGDPIVCAGPQGNIDVSEASFALAPSTLPDRFGGLYVYFGPYAVGPYSEGPYRLTIPQAIFREDLRAQYKPLFEGEAVTGN